MSSFSVMSKKNRFKFGVTVVIIIHVCFFIGFWHVKARRLTAEFVNVDIYAPTAATGLAMYEALANEECVNVVNEQAPTLGMPLVDTSAPLKEDVLAAQQAAAAAKESAGAGTDAAIPNNESPNAEAIAGAPAADVDAAPTEVKLAPSLYYASAPRCKGVVATPAGADKLGVDGFVGLELNINKAGVVQRGEIHRSSGFEDLDTAALKQVTENLTFKPCQKGSEIVGCKQYIKFRWKTN